MFSAVMCAGCSRRLDIEPQAVAAGLVVILRAAYASTALFQEYAAAFQP